MRTIVKGREPGTSLWRVSPVRSGIYRLMKYHVRSKGEKGTLLLNTVTGELVLLSAEEDVILDCLPTAYKAGMDELIAHRFLVPEAFNEQTSVMQLRKVMRNQVFRKDEITNFTILPTTVCNAKCFYCYENDYPRRTMDKGTANLLIDYIVSHCGEAKKVKLHWFGGEPTLGEDCIDYICEQLCSNGIAFSSGMTSNGYLFTQEMARKAKRNWHLRSIQITLDGTEEVYNKVKAYGNVEGSPFRRVLNNIAYLLDEGINVLIRMNLDNHNADNLSLLIDELAERFQHYDRFSVYIHEIFEGMGYEPIQRSKHELQRIIEIKSLLESYIDSKGLKRPAKNSEKELPYLRISYCMADKPSAIMVNPEGRIGKCQHVQYAHLFGDVKKPSEIDKCELQYWMESQPKKGCSDCPLYPSCSIPSSCESGRACTAMEVNQKLDSIRLLCLSTINNNC